MPDKKPLTDVSPVDPQTGGFAAISPSGASENAELIRLVGGNFESGDLPASQWQTSVAQAGTGTVINGELVMTTGVTANGQSFVQSANRARFITATFNKAHLAVQTPNRLNTNVIRRWGAYDPVAPIISGDGVFFQNNGGNISIVRRRGGVDVLTVPLVDFNGNPVPGSSPPVFYVLDEDVSVFEITYNAGAQLLFQNRRLVHKMSELNSVAYDTVHLALGIEIQNINGNTTNNSIKTRGFSISRIGASTSQPNKHVVAGSGSNTLKNSPGTLRSIIIIDTGVGGASIDIFDSATPTGTALFTIDLTDTLTTLPFEFDFNNGLSYDASGAGFELIIVFD